MRKEESHHAIGDQFGGIAAQDAEIDQTIGDEPAGQEMQLAERHAWPHRRDNALLGVQDHLVEVPLGGRVVSADRQVRVTSPAQPSAVSAPTSTSRRSPDFSSWW